MPVRVVELRRFEDLPPPPAPAPVFSSSYVPPSTDSISAGDTLDISIYETGVTLFSGSAGLAGVASGGIDPASRVERMAAIRVDDDGFIHLPFIGRLQATNLTTTQLAAKIRAAYRGMSQNPQVLVSLRDVIGNSLIIGGDVAKPGRLVLATNQETLSDVIALAGGYRGEAKDLSVRIQRADAETEIRLSDALGGAGRDLRVFRGDRISVIRQPRTFSVMGASGKVEQFTFSGPTISLTEAIAVAGGSNPNLGDPAAVFLFRIVRGDDGNETPIVYHLNMMEAGAYFVSQRMAMRDKDVLYVGNARANQPSKLIQIVSQLFAPIVTARDILRSTN
jgi:polysaccharide export outer membrane protein